MKRVKYDFLRKRFEQDTVIEKSRVNETLKRVNKFNVNGLWSLNGSLALGELVFNKNIQAAKQRFYNCGLLAEYLNKEYEHTWLAHGHLYMLYTIMSDNATIIQQVGNLTHPNQQKVFNKNAGVISTSIQCIIRQDWEELQTHIVFLKEQVTRKKPKFTFPDLYVQLHEAFMQGNKKQIEYLLINEFEGTKFKRSMKAEFAHEHLISQITLGYAKLAHYLGIEVEIDSPLVPIDMVPFNPLENYEIPYWFLPGYKNKKRWGLF